MEYQTLQNNSIALCAYVTCYTSFSQKDKPFYKIDISKKKHPLTAPKGWNIKVMVKISQPKNQLATYRHTVRCPAITC